MAHINPTSVTCFVVLLLSASCLARPSDREKEEEIRVYKPNPWPDRTVYYNISKEYSDDEVEKLLDAMNEFNERTCIKFKPYTGHEQFYVSIDRASRRSCASGVGVMNPYGEQLVSLPRGCLDRHSILHEFMHLVGFDHEHNRLDRDDYITINWDNVRPEYRNELSNHVPTYDLPYDYESVLHYKDYYLSSYGRSIFTPKVPVENIGYGTKLSDGDIKKINVLYNCS